MNFKIVFSISVKNAFEILIEITLNLNIALGSKYILTIIKLLVHKYETSFHLFMPSLILFSLFYSFQSTDLSPPWLNLFLSILFFLMLILMGLLVLISLSDRSNTLQFHSYVECKKTNKQ